jgi:Predicted transcriptional regulator with C-terminal CBS domains
LIQAFDGSIIKHFRKEKGISQKGLAKLAGISNSYLSDIEVGRTNPSLKTLLKIAKVLEVDINTFVIEE